MRRTGFPAPQLRGETVSYPSSPYRDRPPRITPALVVDGIVFRRGQVLLIRRAHPPWLGMWALPGGFVELGESTERACAREVREESGITGRIRRLVGVYSRPHRDPRAHIVSVAYELTPVRGRVRGADDASEAQWWPTRRLPRLAADHREMIRDALRGRGARVSKNG